MKNATFYMPILAFLLFARITSGSGEIGFPEDFALSGNRSSELKKLIPGTRDYYYYNCLYLQGEGKLDEASKILTQWIKRYRHTGRVIEIENRQALLQYAEEPIKSLSFIAARLKLYFNHQRVIPGSKRKLPHNLDQKLISRNTLMNRAFNRYRNTIEGFNDSALDWLIKEDLSPDRRRDLLRRMTRPDYGNLPNLIVDDLNYKHSRSFGSYKIHHALLLSQLDECLDLKPDLLNQRDFVNIYISKLRPNPDVNWRTDVKAREAYLDHLWSFVSRLNSSRNSLKANVLYQRLLHDRALGIYNKQRFMKYIALPRNVSYANRDYIKAKSNRDYMVNLGANYKSVTLFPAIGDDEKLVRSFLIHFFTGENSIKPYETYIDDKYLNRCFAETKIVNGLGDMEQWYSMLPPAEYKKLRDRIDIDFAYTNKTSYKVNEPVVLDLYTKNVESLIIKVFEINTLNYYSAKKQEVQTDIDLDGLVANQEKSVEYKDPPLRRVKRTFEFSSIKKRGVFIVEFIGNGKSSRAVIRKGSLHYIERISTAGHVFTIFNEKNKKVSTAELILEGHHYKAREDGTITVPFTNKPGRQQVILLDNDFACLDYFDHESENYKLTAGIHVDREALVKQKKAEVIVRPSLLLNSTPVTLTVLENPSLVIETQDREGVKTTKEVSDFKLYENKESVYEFKVVPNLSKISFTLKAKVQVLSRDKKIDLRCSAVFPVNGIDKTGKMTGIHLIHAGGEYMLEVLGKTGEAVRGKAVEVQAYHQDFRNPQVALLQSDDKGLINMGKLKEIRSFTAEIKSINNPVRYSWILPSDYFNYPGVINAKAFEEINIPYLGDSREAMRSELSLLEKRGSTFFKDRFNMISIKAGFLKIRNLPAGDYDLLIKKTAHITLHVTAGDKREGYIMSGYRQLEQKNTRPLQIKEVKPGKDGITIKIVNADAYTRVHVIATRYVPDRSICDDLNVVRFPAPYLITTPTPATQYVTGRDMGDEFRYILERKGATKYPGNMLSRPGLLLNPWAISSTETGRQQAAGGEFFGRKSVTIRGGRRRSGREPSKGGAGGNRSSEFSNLDFLSERSVVLANLKPGKTGIVTIKWEELKDHQELTILAVNPRDTVYREVCLPVKAMDFVDLRLSNGLDPEKHFTEQKKITVARKGDEFVLGDIKSSDFEAYDTLGRVYSLFMTLSGNSTLGEFEFILNWPNLTISEKREKYSKYSCHELNFFIFKKDPGFFKKVVLPYIENKKDKTFLDNWFLGKKLEDYLEPWAFSQLNIVEKILLAQKLKGEPPRMDRYVKDLFDLVPPDVERFNFLFKTAIRGRALESRDAFGFANAKKRITKTRTLAEKGAAAFKRPSLSALKQKKASSNSLRKMAAKAEVAEKAKSVERFARSKENRKSLALSMDDKAYFAADRSRRKSVQQFYRKLEKTKEWVENNYYHLPIESQNSNLVTVNGFWMDYADYIGKEPFYSTHFAEASRNFSEMMFVLSLLDLPFKAEKHKSQIHGETFSLSPGSPMIIFHKEITKAEPAAGNHSILVSQNYYKKGERYQYEGNRKLDKYITDEFIIHTVYGVQVVVTNPTSSRQKLEVLLQVPAGAIPVLNGRYTRSIHIELDPYRTWTTDYFFYFPFPGQYKHYPVHVAREEKIVAFAAPRTLNVVDKSTKVDKGSWDYISQNGTTDQVVAFLNKHNLGRIDLGKIAWRMQEKEFFTRTISILSKRHVYNNVLWSYGIKYNVLPVAREYLKHCGSFLNSCGEAIDCKLVTIDPVERKTYQHMEYSPLVNARAHKLGNARRIVNNRFYAQYMHLMKILGYRPKLDNDDLMSITYYMLLQDRIDDAIKFFKRVKPGKLETRLQYDYFDAYLDFYTGKLEHSRKLAGKYLNYPVDRWQKRFANIIAQLDEIEGRAAKVTDTKDRTQTQTKLAETEPNFDFEVEAGMIKIAYQNLRECRVNYYAMDIELLFSRNPFVKQYAGQFAYIHPNASSVLTLDPQKSQYNFKLPERFQSRNVMIEILGEGIKKNKAYFSNALSVQLSENYGQLKVTHKKTGKPLAKVYVKVYAKMRTGNIQFFKDGYTDWRGRFDYTSLSTNEIDNVQRFSILILSEDFGAVVKEANPPKR